MKKYRLYRDPKESAEEEAPVVKDEAVAEGGEGAEATDGAGNGE